MMPVFALAAAGEVPAMFQGADCAEVAQYLVDPASAPPLRAVSAAGPPPTLADSRAQWADGRWVVALPDQIRVFEVGAGLDRSWVLAEGSATLVLHDPGLVVAVLRAERGSRLAWFDLGADDPPAAVRRVDEDVRTAWVHDGTVGWLSDVEHPAAREVMGLRAIRNPDPSVRPLLERSLAQAELGCDAMVLSEGTLPWLAVSTLDLASPHGAPARIGLTASDAGDVVPVPGGLLLVDRHGGWHRVALGGDRPAWAGGEAPADDDPALIAYAGDGVVTLSDDGVYRAWGARARLRSAGPWLLSAARDRAAVAGHAGLWVLRRDAETLQVPVDGRVTQLRWMDDGRLLALSADRESHYLVTVDTSTGRLRGGRLPLGRTRWSVVWAGHERALVSNGMNVLLMVELDTGQYAWTALLRQVVPSDDRALQAVQVLPDGRVLVSSSAHAWLLAADGSIADESTWSGPSAD